MKRTILILMLAISGIPLRAQTFTWSGHMAIHDLQTDTVPLTVSGLRNYIDTTFGFAHVCLDIQHPYKSDLVITLISPAGMNITLIQSIGGGGDNFYGTCLGVDGTYFSNAQPPYTGIFKPVGDVSRFNNRQNPNGVWRLIVKDIANADTGFINGFRIEFTNNPPRTSAYSSVYTPSVYTCATCVCPGGTAGCELLPDMTASAKEIQQNNSESVGALDISNATPNIGYGPIEILGIDSCFCGTTPVPCGTTCPNGEEIHHIIKQRIYVKVPGTDSLNYYDRFAGRMTFHPTHNHLHVDDWASYTLRQSTSNPDATTWPILGTAAKQSFCLINLGKCPTNVGECVDKHGNVLTSFPNYDFGFNSGCGLAQGIYPGNYDVYSLSLNEPIDLSNVCDGNYYVVSITDPNNNFLESDETNNWVAVPITLTKQNLAPVISASGSTSLCPGDSVILTASNASHVIWSTGDTTKSIKVKVSGNYTASNRCGTAVSAPIAVTVSAPTSTAGVSISVTSGNNPGCVDDPILFKAVPVNGGLSPAYQWMVNGINAGTNSANFSLPNHVAGQVVTCRVTSSLSCLISNSALSNSITVQTSNATNPSVSIAQSRGANPTCYGDTVAFAATASNARNISYSWRRNGVVVGANSNTYVSTNSQVGDTIRCNITALPICDSKVTLGTGTAQNSITSNAGAAYPTYYGNGRQQYLVRSSELIARGLSAGYFNSLTFTVGNATGDPDTLKGYTIKMAMVTDSILTANFINVTSQIVFGPTNYRPVTNSLNTHFFRGPFYWNGTSNVLVDICFANGVYGNAAYQTTYSTTSFPSSSYFQMDYPQGLSACTNLTANLAHTARPNMIFGVGAPVSVSSNLIIMDVADTLYKFIGNGSWSNSANWLNGKIPPAVLPSCSAIVIDPIASGECVLYTDQYISNGAGFTVVATKKFRVVGKLHMY